MTISGRLSNSSGNLTLLTLLVVVAVLYFAQTVFIPVTLAVLFAFLLGPLVVRFRNWGFGPVTSASVVVLFSLVVAVAISFMMVSQLADLAGSLPGYQENMQKKIRSIRESGSGLITKVGKLVYQMNDQLKPPGPEAVGAPSTEKPVPVEIRHPAFSPVEMIQKVLGSVLHVVVTAAIIVVFVLFMLIQRQDLRERLIRLAGAGRINVTTTVLDDAARRVSRYLLAQLALNASYGVFAGVGLYFIGVPNPALWAILTTLLRYVPYLGIWIAASMPAALAFATDPGWTQLILILALYFGIDMIMYNFLEPLLYGSSTGLSPIAVLVTTVFWTWLWGPVGLLLATPLTVCVVVLGRHVPNLQFLSVLLSDEMPLSDDYRFYQRMLAMDSDEASEIARSAMAGKSLETVYDSVLIPALTLAEHERHQNRLDDERMQFIAEKTREIVDELAEEADELAKAPPQPTRLADRLSGLRALVRTKRRLSESEDDKHTASTKVEPALKPVTRSRIICIPATDEADELAARMLVHLLSRRGIEAEALSSTALASEAMQAVERGGPVVACVCSVPPFGYRQARYLCRRLRGKWPNLKIIGAVLTEGDREQLRQRHPALAADELAVNLQEAVTLATSMIAVEQEPATQTAAAA